MHALDAIIAPFLRADPASLSESAGSGFPRRVKGCVILRAKFL
jgi:hypothetical protein